MAIEYSRQRHFLIRRMYYQRIGNLKIFGVLFFKNAEKPTLLRTIIKQSKRIVYTTLKMINETRKGEH